MFDLTAELPGYDPFEVDFNFLLRELDDQIPKTAENLSALAEQGGYNPDRRSFLNGDLP